MLLLLAIGCGGADKHEEGAPGEVDIQYAPMDAEGTFEDGVLTATFHAGPSTVGWIEYGQDDSYGTSTPPGPAVEEHTVVAIGFVAGQTGHWRAVAEDEDGNHWASEDQTVDPVTWDGPLPELIVDVERPDTPTLIVAGPLLSTVLVVNPAGEPIWWRQVDDGNQIGRGLGDAFSLSTYLRGETFQGIVTWTYGQAEETQRSTPDGHHAWLDLPDGSYLYLARDLRDVDGLTVAADVVIEVSPEGESRTLWNAWDVLTIGFDPVFDSGFYEDAYDFTHCNGLEYREDVDVVLVSCKNVDTVYAISGSDGAPVWTFGSDAGDIRLEAGTAFSGQHSPGWIDGELYVFDNTDLGNSRVVSYTIDETTLVASERYVYKLGEHVEAHGNVVPLSTDRLLVGGGSSGKVLELSGEEAVWGMQIADAEIAWADRLPALGGEVE